MSQRVRARRLTIDEGQYLLRLVRLGRHDSVRYRRALIIMASASGTGVPAIARLVAAHPDTVRDVIHAFNAQGLAMLAPRWGLGRPPGGSPTPMSRSSSPRPRPGRPGSGYRSRTGASAS
jgi:Winged helix-turn helix